MSRRLYPQEIVILALTAGMLLTYWLATARGVLLVLGLLSVGLGAVCIGRPEWLVYGPKASEQLARYRLSWRISGFILLPLGVLFLLLLAFHWSHFHE